jgi:hypothetical protein
MRSSELHARDQMLLPVTQQKNALGAPGRRNDYCLSPIEIIDIERYRIRAPIVSQSKFSLHKMGKFFKVKMGLFCFCFGCNQTPNIYSASVFYAKYYMFPNDNKSTSDHSLLAKFKWRLCKGKHIKMWRHDSWPSTHLVSIISMLSPQWCGFDISEELLYFSVAAWYSSSLTDFFHINS